MTIQDLLREHLKEVGAYEFAATAAMVSRDFYAGAAAMAQQFATNGILYIPNQATGESQGSCATNGDL